MRKNVKVLGAPSKKARHLKKHWKIKAVLIGLVGLAIAACAFVCLNLPTTTPRLVGFNPTDVQWSIDNGDLSVIMWTFSPSFPGSLDKDNCCECVFYNGEHGECVYFYPTDSVAIYNGQAYSYCAYPDESDVLLKFARFLDKESLFL